MARANHVAIFYSPISIKSRSLRQIPAISGGAAVFKSTTPAGGHSHTTAPSRYSGRVGQTPLEKNNNSHQHGQFAITTPITSLRIAEREMKEGRRLNDTTLSKT
ncbi:hypothetical protein MKZ38_006319 [Zalerion maritima]|uniref:Uncharacterized protein n=1 Tax=Zalerion maritima TaxID=339359 RepID=A0AAD5RK41_9PEZI|nr:hypothetical protein MKZ38_006319 [Zalerion maritima]